VHSLGEIWDGNTHSLRQYRGTRYLGRTVYLLTTLNAEHPEKGILRRKWEIFVIIRYPGDIGLMEYLELGLVAFGNTGICLGIQYACTVFNL